MSKTYHAYVKVHLGAITTEEMKKLPNKFADPENPTHEELEEYFFPEQENLAGSNTGSEMIMNTDILYDIEETKPKVEDRDEDDDIEEDEGVCGPD